MTTVNRQITLASRPSGFPAISDFNLVYTTLPVLAAGGALVRSIYLSLDPCMGGWMSLAEPCVPPVAIGEVMGGRAVGFVVESEEPGLRPGDVVEGLLGWQEYAVVPASSLRKIDPGLAPVSTALGVLGLPGLTAFFGLLDVCDPQPGETVVVSGAAGAVGMIVGQVAKIKGCRVVAAAGAGAKMSWMIDELGFDAVLDYKSAVDFYRELEELCPDGVDIYFDNVGGAMTDTVLRQINAGTRVSVCDQSSQRHLEKPEMGPRWLGQLIVKEAKVQGFLVSSYAARFPEGLEQLARWLTQGKLKYREEVAQGIEAAPQAFIGMLHGRNQGQQLVQLSELRPRAKTF